MKIHPTRGVSNETRKALRSLRGHNIVEEMARGPYHDFWLLREDEYAYDDYEPFLGRRDAPVIMSDDVRGNLFMGLRWTPTVFPHRSLHCVEYGLEPYALTVINQIGALVWSQILRSYTQIFAAGPPMITFPLRVCDLGQDGLSPRDKHFVQIGRDLLVSDLNTLAQWGDKAATGEYFILHIGI